MSDRVLRLRVPTWVQDVLLAGFVTLMQIQGTDRVAANADPEVVSRSLSELGHMGYVLLTVSGLALVVRRRWPAPVFLFTAAVSLAYFGAEYPDGPGWVGLFVALYTLTAYGDGRVSLQISAASITVLTVGWLLMADLEQDRAGWVFFRIGVTIMAAALGESVRSRRVIAAEAQQRAERAERTREEEARRRVDAERLRIAREVHDTVAHAIAIINVQAGVTAHVLDRRPDRARETLVTIEQTSAQALREMRATLGVLRGDGDHDDSPSPGLDRTDELVALARTAGLEVKLDVGTPHGELPGAVDRAAYRIVQESITNVIRHAGGAAEVTVTLEFSPHDLEVRVTDDGSSGRDAPSAITASAGRGIRGMQERCKLFGGELVAGPRPEGGYQVWACLPLTTAETMAR